MSSLKSHEKRVFEDLFDRGGYVLNFTDARFAEFFREHKITIDDQKYKFNGASKMKRLRAFWEVEPDPIVGAVLDGLLKYACGSEEVDEGKKKEALEIISRLKGESVKKKSEPSTEQDFLKQEFQEIDLTKLQLDNQFQSVLRQRIDEIQKALRTDAPLAVIFLCGSTLEGLLLDVAAKQPQSFNQAKSTPKNKENNALEFQDWSLRSLIDVAYEMDWISLDVQKHSHSLRDFRNFIHPREQIAHKFTPDINTAKISWQVLQAAIAQIIKNKN